MAPTPANPLSADSAQVQIAKSHESTNLIQMTTPLLATAALLVATVVAQPSAAQPIDRTTLGSLDCLPGEIAVKIADGSTTGGNGTREMTWACVTAGPSYVFISSAKHDGVFGVDAWDAVCDAEAEAAGLPPGDYAAWLSSAGQFDARDILPPGPFYGVNGAILAISKADLLDGMLIDGILYDADGEFDGLKGPWTGTDGDGTATGLDCHNWTRNDLQASGGTSGSAGETSFLWTNSNVSNCNLMKPVFCIQLR